MDVQKALAASPLWQLAGMARRDGRGCRLAIDDGALGSIFKELADEVASLIAALKG